MKIDKGGSQLIRASSRIFVCDDEVAGKQGAADFLL